MVRRFSTTALAFLLSAAAASASTVERKDLQVFNDISKSVNHYTHFTIFDDVSATVKDGVVTLDGHVTMPYKRSDIEQRVAKVDGVLKVRDQIAVLPVSLFDDQLRLRLARAIYRSPGFWMYGVGANPAIHIVVENGHVTLTGVVNNPADRQIAGSIARNQFGVTSLKNELKTHAEVKEALEKL